MKRTICMIALLASMWGCHRPLKDIPGAEKYEDMDFTPKNYKQKLKKYEKPLEVNKKLSLLKKIQRLDKLHETTEIGSYDHIDYLYQKAQCYKDLGYAVKSIPAKKKAWQTSLLLFSQIRMHEKKSKDIAEYVFYQMNVFTPYEQKQIKTELHQLHSP